MSGWFDPPLCIFHELPDWLGDTGRTPCDDFERAVILGGVLRRLGGEVFGRMHRAEDFIGAVDRLFGELIAEGVRPQEFRAALEALRDAGAVMTDDPELVALWPEAGDLRVRELRARVDAAIEQAGISPPSTSIQARSSLASRNASFSRSLSRFPSVSGGGSS